MKEYSIVQEFIDKSLQSNSVLLEAGCGSSSKLDLSRYENIHGIDISEKQLNRNSLIKKKIVGDLQDHLFQDKYDCIISWDVLEHLERPQSALKNLFTSLSKNGILIISIPNVISLKGLITKVTPLAFHRFFYRKYLGSKINIKEDFGPFKTYLKYYLRSNNLKKVLLSNNFSHISVIPYEPMLAIIKKKRPSIYLIYKILSIIGYFSTFTFFCGFRKSDFILLCKK